MNLFGTGGVKHGVTYGLCPVLTPDSKKEVKGPLIVVYYKVDYTKNKKGTNYWRNRVMKVATKYTEEDVKFGVADSSEFREELTALGFAPNLENPVAAAWDSSGSKYKMEEDMTPDGKTLSEFVSKFLAGEVEPHLKSEAIPEPNDGPVKVVVGKTFSDIVMDETKDVLIEFYAPWCGHCKQLEPKYEELGEKMKEFEHVVIAKMDATANDSPGAFEVSGFPTIYWAPAGRKSNPQKYQGGREVDDFVKFIKKESSKPINLKPTKKTDEL